MSAALEMQTVAARKRLQPSPFMKDLLLTAATSVVTLICLVLFTRYLATGLGAEKFGAFGLARRFWSTLASIITVLGLALARQIAIARSDSEKHAYLLSGSCMAAGLSAVVLLAGFLFRDRLTLFVFHDPNYAHLFLATLLMFAGTCFYGVLYAFYRGSNQMWKANLWTMAVIAAGPTWLAWRLAPLGRLELIVVLSSILLFLTCGPLAAQLAKALSAGRRTSLLAATREIVRYGAPRIPAGFAFAAMLATGPFLAAYIGAIDGAGFLVTAQALVTIAQTGTDAFSLVALPKVAQLALGEDMAFLGERTTDVAAFVLHVGLFLMLQLLLWSDVLVIGWLGESFRAAVPITRLTVLGTLPFLAYSTMRPIIDAVEVRAVNTRNIIAALLVTLCSSVVLEQMRLGLIGLAIGTTLGFYTLGLLSLHFLWERFGISRDHLLVVRSVLLNVVLICLGLLFKRKLEPLLSTRTLFAGAAALVTVSGLLYFGVLRLLRARWILEIERRLVPALTSTSG